MRANRISIPFPLPFNWLTCMLFSEYYLLGHYYSFGGKVLTRPIAITIDSQSRGTFIMYSQSVHVILCWWV